MKALYLFLAMVSLPAFAGHRVDLEPDTRPVRKLEDLQPGDEIGFPYGFSLTRSHQRPEFLSHWLKFRGDDTTYCVFETPAGDRDDFAMTGSLYWEVKQRPREIHELFRRGRTMLVLTDRRTGREVAMTCDERVDLDCLREADFDVPDVTERRVRYESSSFQPGDAPAESPAATAL